MLYTTTELNRISQLLLHEDPTNIRLGLQLLREDSDGIPVLYRELLLLVVAFDMAEGHNLDYQIHLEAESLLLRVFDVEDIDVHLTTLRVLNIVRFQEDYTEEYKYQCAVMEALPDYEARRAEFEPLILRNAIYRDWYFELGYVHMMQKQFDKAESYWLIFLEQEIPNRDILFELAFMYAHLGRESSLKKAIAVIEKLFPKDPYLPKLRLVKFIG